MHLRTLRTTIKSKWISNILKKHCLLNHLDLIAILKLQDFTYWGYWIRYGSLFGLGNVRKYYLIYFEDKNKDVHKRKAI